MTQPWNFKFRSCAIKTEQPSKMARFIDGRSRLLLRQTIQLSGNMNLKPNLEKKLWAILGCFLRDKNVRIPRMDFWWHLVAPALTVFKNILKFSDSNGSRPIRKSQISRKSWESLFFQKRLWVTCCLTSRLLAAEQAHCLSPSWAWAFRVKPECFNESAWAWAFP